MKNLWYDNEARVWNEALPVGNGRLGAMVFGGATYDRLALNEETLWSGQPDSYTHEINMEEIECIRRLVSQGKYVEAHEKTSEIMPGYTSQAYVPYGELHIDVLSVPSAVTDYKRLLDMERGITKATYKLGGVNVEKTVFVSLKDDVIVYNVKMSQPLELRIQDACELFHTTSVCANTITTVGRCPTKIYRLECTLDPELESIPFTAMTKVIALGENVQIFGVSSLHVKGATEITVITSIKTGFAGYNKMPVSNGRDHGAMCLKTLEEACAYSCAQLLLRHEAEYKKYFDRVSLKIEGEDHDDEPTDKRIKLAGQGRVDNGLVTLLFDFGRYLAISGAGGTQPTNLQGIWNDCLIPPWNSNYTVNINTEMNYWPMETCDLGELTMPLMNMLKELSQRGNHFGLNGWNCFHNTDIWRFNYAATKAPTWGFWPTGGCWLARHIWEHYLHTRDKDFLAEYYPVLEGAVKFLCDWLYDCGNGVLSVCPSTSPENHFSYDGKTGAVAEGSAMDLEIIIDLFDKTIKAGHVLGNDVSLYENILPKIKRPTIGDDGRLLEWGKPFDEPEPGHRHISHLYGFYPADVLGDEYRDAVKKSLEYRLSNGGGHTGWSNAWIANVYARLGDGEGVMGCIRNMFAKSIYSNMFDAHPPFQIDGNFGICAAICEALMQSNADGVKLCPALPKEWEHGEFSGFVARTGEKVSYKW